MSIAAGADEFTIQERLELPRSPRRITQVRGTEYRRQSKYGHPNYWIEKNKKILRESTTPYAVTDGRTFDEINWAKSFGLKRIHVVRPEYATKIAKHETEMIPPPDSQTLVLENGGTLDELYEMVDAVAIPAVANLNKASVLGARSFAPRMSP